MKTKDFIKKDWAILFLLLLPFIAIALYWNSIPDQIPMHWNFAGEIDRYDSKIPSIFYIPALAIFMYAIFLVIPRFDPMKRNYELFAKTYQIIKFSLISLMTLLSLIILLASTGVKMDIMYWVIIPIIILFLIMGNTFGTLRPNWFVGIRVPWTLMNEEVWRSTHRLAGYIWVWGSLIMLLFVFLLPAFVIKVMFWCFIGIIILIPVIFSYFDYRKKKNNNN